MPKKIVMKHQELNALCAESEDLGLAMTRLYRDEDNDWDKYDIALIEQAAERFQVLADKLRGAVKDIPNPQPENQNYFGRF